MYKYVIYSNLQMYSVWEYLLSWCLFVLHDNQHFPHQSPRFRKPVLFFSTFVCLLSLQDIVPINCNLQLAKNSIIPTQAAVITKTSMKSKPGLHCRKGTQWDHYFTSPRQYLWLKVYSCCKCRLCEANWLMVRCLKATHSLSPCTGNAISTFATGLPLASVRGGKHKHKARIRWA